MIEIISISAADERSWMTLSQASSYRSFFQSRECYAFYTSLSFFEPFFYGVSEDGVLKGVIVGYIQQEKCPVKQHFTGRAIAPGGPMLSDDISAEAMEALLEACKSDLSRKSIYIEFRNFHDYSKYRETFRRCGFEYRPHLNFQIDTSSEDVMLSNLGRSRKRDIKTSFRDGATVVESPTLEDVRAFYGILVELYSTKVKTPLFPFGFFEELYSSGLGIYRLVRLDSEIVGGTLCVGLTGGTLYEWFACGKDGACKSVFPSTVATYSGMEYAARNGYPVFDMMGAGRPDEGYGVRDFKAKFGGRLVEHGRFLCVCRPLLYRIGSLGVRILKSL